MKTYTKTVVQTLPRLVITHEDMPTSPREWDNLGYFITCDKRTISPDDMPDLKSMIQTAGDEAETQQEHIKLIKAGIEQEGKEKVLAIYPIVKYEHSSVSYSLGKKHGFDCSNNGFYIVTDKSAKVLGTPNDKKAFERLIRDELKAYNTWVNGEVYSYTLYDKNGKEENSCCGFYDLEEIKDDLSTEWSKEIMRDYLVY